MEKCGKLSHIVENMTHFSSRISVKVDDKGRLRLPTKFSGDLQSFVITNSSFKKTPCLDVFPEALWQKKLKEWKGLKNKGLKYQAFYRFYIAGAQTVERDKQNRLSLSPDLKSYLGLRAEAVVVGMGEKFEIWSVENWNKVYNEFTESFEGIYESLFE